MKSLTFLLFLLSYSLLSDAQSTKSATNFTLRGIVTGNVHTLILTYPDIPRQRHSYTIHVKKGHFIFKGYINSPVYANIMNDIRAPHPSNAIDLFLSPGNMTISLKGDHFDEAKITGSATHDELDNLQKIYTPINKVRDSLFNILFAIERAGNTPKNHIAHQAVAANIDKCQLQIDQIDYHYISTHTQSYISAYLLSNLAWGEMRRDSIERFYNAFSDAVKKSASGRAIKKVIVERTAGSVGTVVQMPGGINLNGSKFNPNTFKINNYSLLYFWADWANDSNKLKEIYSKYQLKGLTILAISNDPFIKGWRDTLKKEHIGMWQNIFSDPVGNLDTFYNIRCMTPSLILLVDKNHNIIGRYRGNAPEWYKFDYQEGDINNLDKKLVELYNMH